MIDVVAGESRRGGSLDRRGSHLLSGGDTLLALTGSQLGLGWGIFPRLRVTHLIPRGRVGERYLLDLREKMTASHCLLRYVTLGSYSSPVGPWTGQARYCYHFLRLLILGRWTEWRFYRADIRGYRLASELIAENMSVAGAKDAPAKRFS